jgi:molybdopterin synthase catalytic subunit
VDKAKYLYEGPIPAGMATAGLSTDGHRGPAGAQALFIGQVRGDRVDGKKVVAIEYSAYEEMVGPVADAIREELTAAYPDLFHVEIIHSTGRVDAGEISLLVRVVSGHRRQSFAALEQCVERIKERLPVWKKELFEDGSSRWIQ